MSKEATATANPDTLDVIKEIRDREDSDGVLTLTTGVRIRYIPVNPATFTEILAAMKPPKPPEVWLETKGRFELNPADPTYLGEMDNWQGDRATAMMDAFALLGCELVDGMPEDDSWLKKLKMLERMGRLDLSKYDLDDEMDLTFLYIKNVAFGPEDWGAVFRAFNVTSEGVESANAGF
jgi:hypothetical protein